MKTGFRLVALNKSLFEPLFRLNDEELSKRGVRRLTADEFPGYPCRVSLADAAVGEEVILLPYEHHAVDSPYRSGGPVFVRKAAETVVAKVPGVAGVSAVLTAEMPRAVGKAHESARVAQARARGTGGNGGGHAHSHDHGHAHVPAASAAAA